MSSATSRASSAFAGRRIPCSSRPRRDRSASPSSAWSSDTSRPAGRGHPLATHLSDGGRPTQLNRSTCCSRTAPHRDGCCEGDRRRGWDAEERLKVADGAGALRTTIRTPFARACRFTRAPRSAAQSSRPRLARGLLAVSLDRRPGVRPPACARAHTEPVGASVLGARRPAVGVLGSPVAVRKWASSSRSLGARTPAQIGGTSRLPLRDRQPRRCRGRRVAVSRPAGCSRPAASPDCR